MLKRRDVRSLHASASLYKTHSPPAFASLQLKEGDRSIAMACLVQRRVKEAGCEKLADTHRLRRSRRRGPERRRLESMAG